jgi:hypothetical protein
MKYGKRGFGLFYLIIGFVLLFSPFSAGAVSPSSILVKISPENPSPGQTVNISLSSYSSNLDSVGIKWSVNDKIMLSGTGKKSFSVVAPKAGEESSVVATISLPDGEINKRITIRPAVMAILWQANDSYVPPFYKGKALPTPDSEIKVVAIPEIKNGGGIVNPKNMVYAWKKDYTNIQDSSGYGKNYFLFSSDYLEDSTNISVTASTTDQQYTSAGSIDITTINPEIVFYKNDYNMGTLWDQALSYGHQIFGEEIIEAAPYFISPKEIRTPILTWDWSINDIFINNSEIRKNVLPLRAQSGSSGTSKIKLEINNNYKIFQTATGEINVTF